MDMTYSVIVQCTDYVVFPISQLYYCLFVCDSFITAFHDDDDDDDDDEHYATYYCSDYDRIHLRHVQ